MGAGIRQTRNAARMGEHFAHGVGIAVGTTSQCVHEDGLTVVGEQPSRAAILAMLLFGSGV